MITSHVLQYPWLSSSAHYCLLLALPALSLRSSFASSLKSLSDVHGRISLGLWNRASNTAGIGFGEFRRNRDRVSDFVSQRRGFRQLGSKNNKGFGQSIRGRVSSVAGSHLMDGHSSAETVVREEVQKADPIVQYIVLRKDLVDTMNWPLGSVISQGCHAAVAAIWLHKDDSVTAKYCGSENLDHMHKVTLEVKGETQLRNLAQKLETGGVAHKLWMEQPENIPTCLATKPYPKSEVASFFKSLKLCR